MAGETVPTLATQRVSCKELPKTLKNARAALGLSADALARIALKLGAPMESRRARASFDEGLEVANDEGATY